MSTPTLKLIGHSMQSLPHRKKMGGGGAAGLGDLMGGSMTDVISETGTQTGMTKDGKMIGAATEGQNTDPMKGLNGVPIVGWAKGIGDSLEALGTQIGGERGGNIVQGFTNPLGRQIEVLKGDGFTRGQKALAAMVPFASGFIQDKSPAERQPMQYTKTQITEDGGYRRMATGGPTTPTPSLHPSLAYSGGGMSKLYNVGGPNGLTVYQTLGKRHSQGGIRTADGQSEYEEQELFMQDPTSPISQDGYFVRREHAMPLMNIMKKELAGQRNPTTLKALAMKAFKDNEQSLQLEASLTGDTLEGNRSVNARPILPLSSKQGGRYRPI